MRIHDFEYQLCAQTLICALEFFHKLLAVISVFFKIGLKPSLTSQAPGRVKIQPLSQDPEERVQLFKNSDLMGTLRQDVGTTQWFEESCL